MTVHVEGSGSGSGLSARDVGRAYAVLAAVLGPLTLLVVWGPTLALLLVFALVPVMLFLALHGQSDGVVPIPGLFVSGGFAVFFGAGVIDWAISAHQLSTGVARSVSAGEATWVMASLALIVSAFVIGERLAGPPANKAPNSPKINIDIAALAELLFGLSIVGAVLTVQRLHGWRGAAELLAPHNKASTAVISGSLGFSLWDVFALPAIVALGAAAIGARRRVQRVTLWTEAALLSYISLALFGSRLVVTLAAIGIVSARFAVTGQRLSKRAMAVGLAALLVVSGFVLGARASSGGGPQAFPRPQLQTLGYGLFDVSVGAYSDRATLAPQYRSPDRSLAILASAVPAIGRRSATLNKERVDVITVQALGSATQANTTGFPPSMPTFLLVAFGRYFGAIFALIAGIAVGLLTRVLRTGGPAMSLFFGLWVAFVFNDFKGGDLLLDGAAEAKRWIYLALLIGLVHLLSHRRSAAA